MNYEPLTKTIIDDQDNQMAVCRLYDTDECHLHMPNGCKNCGMFNAIITQLHTFEKIYLESNTDGNVQ